MEEEFGRGLCWFPALTGLDNSSTSPSIGSAFGSAPRVRRNEAMAEHRVLSAGMPDETRQRGDCRVYVFPVGFCP